MAVHKIEIQTKNDTRAEVLKTQILNIYPALNITNIQIIDAYLIEHEQLSEQQLTKIRNLLSNKITQSTPNFPNYNYAIEISFLPGVTDNLAQTAKETINDALNIQPTIATSQIILLETDAEIYYIEEIANNLHNKLIQKAIIQTEYSPNKTLPKVILKEQSQTKEVNLNLNDQDLELLGKNGINGPLALNLQEMKVIKNYFKDRNPTDIELETLAQTWSEHCKHKIFAAKIDNIDSLYKTYIKEATKQINSKITVSVFKDNAGAIILDENNLITHKVETHNSPSALDPFGGAITGILGVNRDTIGFGLGAKPIINTYGFCFGYPNDRQNIFRQKDKKDPMLLPKRIIEGVVKGINAGGNCSGIPSPQGFVRFDPRYKGKPLVFCGTVGLIPKQANNKPLHEKQAQPDDFIVMIGGRVGQDGIHGATFSSESLNTNSPATAVQIGDPITQKKFSDAITKELRDLNLYNSITDNGAGGLSSSIGEMAEQAGGAIVNLEQVPLKYPNLEPWKIWISESQERMTLSVPQEKWPTLKNLLNNRGVEATVIGKFTKQTKLIINYNNKTIANLDMDFLHNGLPQRILESEKKQKIHDEPTLEEQDLSQELHSMLLQPNISSYEFISQQYDHEVQAGSVLKPLVGKGRLNHETSITRPILNSNKAILLSQGLYPKYSDIDTYHMAAASIDTAVRNIIAAGGSLKHLALLDNFCWCSSNNKDRLYELKQAAKACFDLATFYKTPFISGKDSMFNDFKGYTDSNQELNISIPPTLLISSIAVQDINNTLSPDTLIEGDLLYILGDTNEELGASEYYNMLGYTGNNVPKVDQVKNKQLYDIFEKNTNLIASAISVTLGGLAIAIAKTAIASQKGITADLTNIKGNAKSSHSKLFSESQGRILVSINPKNKTKFETIFKVESIGIVRDDLTFEIFNNKKVVDTNIHQLTHSYKQTFKKW